MPSWRTQGVRSLRPLSTTNACVCRPCRLRLFSTTTSRPLRWHSPRLLDTAANKSNHVSPASYDDATQTDPLDDPEDFWPFNKDDLKKSGKTKHLETSANKHATWEKYENTDSSKESGVKTSTSLPFDPSIIRTISSPERSTLPQSSREDDSSTTFKPLLPSDGDTPATADSPRSITDFFKSPDASSASSGYDGGAIQSLRDAMLSIKNDPISFAWNRTPRRLRNRRQRFVNSAALQTPENIAKVEKKKEADEKRALKYLAEGTKTMDASSIGMERLDVGQPCVPHLHHGLDRVLFTQGVYQLQDPRSRVYNFDPYLQKIMPVTEFDYEALSAYKTSSQDEFLSKFAKKHGKKYVGSTSSMTSTLTHFHYLLSSWRKLNTDMFSRDFPDTLQSYTALNRTPTSIFLRRKGDTYAIDADKEFDGANILMLLGRSMEKLMTLPVSEFERYRKDKSGGLSEVERNKPEAYHYSSLGDFLLRSQLDARDDRLPGTGMFDLKTRAVLPIRMQSQDHEPMTGYEITQAQGQYESFEREYYDMLRSTALKYSLQARMGHMDGIFVAYHNVKRIFGFQYISLNELDRAIHGQSDRTLGNREFNLSISLLNEILNKATEKFPDQSIRLHFETRPAETLPSMHIYAEPMSEEDIDTIQNSQKEKIAEWERALRDPASKLNEEQVADLVKEYDETLDDFGDSSSDLSHGLAEKAVSSPEEILESQKPQSETTGAQDAQEDPIVEEIEDISETSEPASGTDKTEKPLLGMTLTVRSKVNGVYVDRPEFLRKSHDWSIEYSVTEMTTTQAWRQYDLAKARRRKTFAKTNKADVTNPDSSEATYKEHYIGMLKDLSDKGRTMRARLDQSAANKPKIVVGMPYVKSLEGQRVKTNDVSIESVDDYLTWLYAEKESPVKEESSAEEASPAEKA